MNLPHIFRTGIGAVISRVPGIDNVKSAAEQAPAKAISTALKTAEIGMAGYAVAARTAGQVTGVARQGVTAATSLLSRNDEEREAPTGPTSPTGPTDDPWAGGPLRPVDDIREASFLTQDDAAAVEATPSGGLMSHDELPLADYDHLTLGELRSRIRGLDLTALIQLREYERAHADRLPVVKAFDTRIAALGKESAGRQSAAEQADTAAENSAAQEHAPAT